MILMMGVAGSGKGTQCELLAARLGYAHISSGNLVREFASDEQRTRMLQGLYLTDDDIVAMFEGALKKAPDANKVILDGIPRTIKQAEYLFAGSARGRWHLEAAIILDIAPEVVRKRMLERGRVDDTDTAITARIQEFQQQTLPVIDFLKQHGVTVFVIDGSQGIEAVRRLIDQDVAAVGLAVS